MEKYVYIVGRLYVECIKNRGEAEHRTENFPEAIFTKEEEAKEYYEKLRKENWSSTGEWCQAYICKMELNKKEAEIRDLLMTFHEIH